MKPSWKIDYVEFIYIKPSWKSEYVEFMHEAIMEECMNMNAYIICMQKNSCAKPSYKSLRVCIAGRREANIMKLSCKPKIMIIGATTETKVIKENWRNTIRQ